jgi:hypothetical protein
VEDVLVEISMASQHLSRERAEVPGVLFLGCSWCLRRIRVHEWSCGQGFINLSTHCTAGREEKEELGGKDACLIRMCIRAILQNQISEDNYTLAVIIGLNRKPEGRQACQDPFLMNHTAGLQIAAVADEIGMEILIARQHHSKARAN